MTTRRFRKEDVHRYLIERKSLIRITGYVKLIFMRVLFFFSAKIYEVILSVFIEIFNFSYENVLTVTESKSGVIIASQKYIKYVI